MSAIPPVPPAVEDARPPLAVRDVEDRHELIRSCINDRVIVDENTRDLRFFSDEKTFAFVRDSAGKNTGLSVDNLDWIKAEHSGETVAAAILKYIAPVMSESYFKKRCWAVLNTGELRAQRLQVTHTPKYDGGKSKPRLHHCDVWPSSNEDDYIGGQRAFIEANHKVIVDNRDP